MPQRDPYHYLVSWCPYQESYVASPLEAHEYYVYGKTPEDALARCRKSLWRDLDDHQQTLDPFPEVFPNACASGCRTVLLEQESAQSVESAELIGGLTIYRCDECDIETDLEGACEHILEWVEARRVKEE